MAGAFASDAVTHLLNHLQAQAACVQYVSRGRTQAPTLWTAPTQQTPVVQLPRCLPIHAGPHPTKSPSCPLLLSVVCPPLQHTAPWQVSPPPLTCQYLAEQRSTQLLSPTLRLPSLYLGGWGGGSMAGQWCSAGQHPRRAASDRVGPAGPELPRVHCCGGCMPIIHNVHPLLLLVLYTQGQRHVVHSAMAMPAVDAAPAAAHGAPCHCCADPSL
jgi:hypothetical protein